jgi:RNA polymerase sigma-70 factor (ECF subfamily)
MNPEKGTVKREFSYKKKSDRRLLQKTILGNSLAFDVLYERYYLLCVSRARQYVTEEDAKDITQAIFAELWDNPEKFKPSRNGSLMAFLLTCVHNSCCNFLKKKNKEVELPDADSLSDEEEVLPAPDEVYKRMYAILTEDEIYLIKSKIIDEKSMEQIAKEQKIALNAAYQRFHRAKMKLENDPYFQRYFNEYAGSVIQKGEKEK